MATIKLIEDYQDYLSYMNSMDEMITSGMFEVAGGFYAKILTMTVGDLPPPASD